MKNWSILIDPRAEQIHHVMYLVGARMERSNIEKFESELTKLVEARELPPFLLTGITITDWDNALTPWPAPGLEKGDPDFTGEAAATLRWLQEEYLPELEQKYQITAAKRYICGYSLAGLFALWAVMQTDRFRGCASCSGSLWFPGWREYLRDHLDKLQSGRVYLSLGRTEEKSKNVLLSGVGAATREAAELLAAKLKPENVALQWEDGGHFRMIEQRLLRAITWLLRNASQD